jgi:hypothetical protein
MKMNPNKAIKSEKLKFQITEKGSLGLLAFGDIGLREWRKVKRNTPKEEL